MKVKAIAVSALISTICLSSCREETKLDSDDFEDRKERIETLEAEIKAFSKISDAEFELFNVNGFSNSGSFTIPGPTSFNYIFVVRIDTSDIDKWLTGMAEVDTVFENESSLFNKVVASRKENWIVASKPKHFTRVGEKGVEMLVYEKEGILYKEVTRL